MRAHDLIQLVAPGVLERADGDDLVVLLARVAEIGLDHVERFLEMALADLVAHHLHLLRDGVESRHLRAVVLLGMEHEAAEAGADVDHGLAGRELDLAAHVLDLVQLRFLERNVALDIGRQYVVWGQGRDVGLLNSNNSPPLDAVIGPQPCPSR